MYESSCALPLTSSKVITLAHGSGGKQTQSLIEKLFLPAFANPYLASLHDGALLPASSSPLVFTTDSYVVQPLFFPGGDIGKLAVTGTLNDLAMCGARPRYLSCSMIIEEGFLQKDLKRIVDSIKKEALSQSVQIVTGDTKVIERTTGKNFFINTSGIGIKIFDDPIEPSSIQEGDVILLSGDVGRHGIAVIAEREGLAFSSPLLSDCAPLFPLVESLLSHHISIHCLRDITRGGLATALVELAETSQKDFLIEEEKIPVHEAVHSASEILGFDPLYVASEGRFISFIPASHAQKALAILKTFPEGKEASLIGKVTAKSPSPRAIISNVFGMKRYLYRLAGDQLPRIC